MPTILLVDDDERVLEDLGKQIRERLDESEAVVREWQPKAEHGPPLDQLEEQIGDDVTLVVTDYDLSITRSGILGDSIVRWCQRRALPAVIYTRGDQAELPAIPDLFELKAPRDSTAGKFLAELFRGFAAIDKAVDPIIRETMPRNPASVLARILGDPDLEYELAPYTVRVGESGALTSLVQKTAPHDAQPSSPDKIEIQRVLSYVLSHLMVNAVLPYPGPLLRMEVLCGYIGTTIAEAGDLGEIFKNAKYSGPFGTMDEIFWRSKVDEELEKWLPPEADANSDTIRRRAVERRVGRALVRHECPRCDGINGGFYCPFTRRSVCERADCSTASNSWLPPGSTLCRIELDFFEEWAPLLGY